MWTDLFNTVYDREIIPADWLKSTFMLIPKKVNARNCNKYQTICLKSYVFKIFKNVIHARIHPKLEKKWMKHSLDFFKRWVQNVWSSSCECFNSILCWHRKIIWQSQQHDPNFWKLYGTDDKDLRPVANIYWKQTACVQIWERTTEDILIKREVRQRCVLLPLIFNVCSEYIFKEALSGMKVLRTMEYPWIIWNMLMT